MIKVLFLCIHNSARSQMAEAYMKKLGGNKFVVESAGLETGTLNPLAVEVMLEDGIDISQNKTKNVFDFFKEGRLYHYVVTVCDEASAAQCPIFPGVHNRAKFDVHERETAFRIDVNSLDQSAHVLVDGQITTSLPPNSVFTSVADASQFFAAGSLGYSPAGEKRAFDGLELRTFDWRVEPLQVTSLESSFFDDRDVFPPGTAVFDNALLMRGIEHEWHSRESLCCEPVQQRANVAN